jgi:hypothetical protein
MQVNGVSYNIEWRKFHVGWSFFLPCLRIEEGKQEVRVVMKRLKFRIAIKPVIEDGVKGLRVWRIR